MQVAHLFAPTHNDSSVRSRASATALSRLLHCCAAALTVAPLGRLLYCCTGCCAGCCSTGCCCTGCTGCYTAFCTAALARTMCCVGGRTTTSPNHSRPGRAQPSTRCIARPPAWCARRVPACTHARTHARMQLKLDQRAIQRATQPDGMPEGRLGCEMNDDEEQMHLEDGRADSEGGCSPFSHPTLQRRGYPLHTTLCSYSDVQAMRPAQMLDGAVSKR